MAATKRQESPAQFFKRLEARIEQESMLSRAPGIRRTARIAAAERARIFLTDLTDLKAQFETRTGQGNAK